jgi:hypothetical protein
MRDDIPLVLLDESTAGPFVTGGALRLPAGSVGRALTAIGSAKERCGVPAEARIHCRVLFAADARRKSPFRDAKVDDLHGLLTESVGALNALGASWRGCWVDQSRYPKVLRLVDGVPFKVTNKHLAGLVCFGALAPVEHDFGAAYQLAFDPDPTKIDWGLVYRQQATHFSRTHSNAIQLPQAYRPLLEMADIAAYTVAQSLPADLEPSDRSTSSRRTSARRPSSAVLLASR